MLPYPGDRQCAIGDEPGRGRQQCRNGPANVARLVIRYNAHGIAGLADRWAGGRPPILEETQRAELLEIVLKGPDLVKDGFCAFTRDDLVAIAKKRFGKSMHATSMGRLLRRLGLSRQKPRPNHPLKNPAAEAAFKKSPARAEKTSAHA